MLSDSSGSCVVGDVEIDVKHDRAKGVRVGGKFGCRMAARFFSQFLGPDAQELGHVRENRSASVVHVRAKEERSCRRADVNDLRLAGLRLAVVGRIGRWRSRSGTFDLARYDPELGSSFGVSLCVSLGRRYRVRRRVRASRRTIVA